MPVSPSELTNCDTCHEQVLWTVTAAGNRKAVNPNPDDLGNTAVYTDAVGRVRSRQLSKERPTLEHAEWLAMPHVATCVRPRPRTPQRRPRPRPRGWAHPGWMA